MKKIFLFLLCLHLQLSAGAVSWLSNTLGTQYFAAQAYKKQDYDQALIEYHNLMNTDPYNPLYNYNVGIVLYRQRKYEDAKQAFLRTFEHVEKESKIVERVNFNLGNSCFQLKQWQQAIDAYQQVLKINESNEQAQHNLQLALYKLKEQELKKQSEKNQQQNKQQEKQAHQTKSKEEKSTREKNKLQDELEEKNSSSSDQQKFLDELQKNQKLHEQKNMQDGQQQAQNQEDQQQAEEQFGDEKQASSQQLSGEEKLDCHQLSDNSLHDGGGNQQSLEDIAKKVEHAQDTDAYEQKIKEEQGAGDDKKEMGGYKTQELKNQLQEQYEGKASQDNRLTDYHASVMKTLEELEKEIQKYVIKNKVAMQGANQHGKKGW